MQDLKVNAVDLKKFKLAIVDDKGKVIPIVQLGAVEYTKKNGNKSLTHFQLGSKFEGDIVAELPDDNILLLQGRMYSRKKASVVAMQNKVGGVL